MRTVGLDLFTGISEYGGADSAQRGQWRLVGRLAAGGLYQRAERRSTPDDSDEINRIPCSALPARRAENLVHGSIGVMQPESELGVLHGGKEGPADLFVVEPLDPRCPCRPCR